MNEFQSNGCLQVPELIDANTIQTISLYFENKIKRGEWQSKPETDDSSKLGYYADPLIEVLLEQCLPAVEEKVNLSLEPTYSYSRVYQEGEELLSHMDRPSCEISVTINVACTGDPWPIWMQYQSNDPVKYILNPGDAVIYKGCEVNHWRTKLPTAQLNVQFMLHYVDKNGPYSEYKFDKRGSLGSKSIRT